MLFLLFGGFGGWLLWGIISHLLMIGTVAVISGENPLANLPTEEEILQRKIEQERKLTRIKMNERINAKSQ